MVLKVKNCLRQFCGHAGGSELKLQLSKLSSAYDTAKQLGAELKLEAGRARSERNSAVESLQREERRTAGLESELAVANALLDRRLNTQTDALLGRSQPRISTSSQSETVASNTD